MTIHNDPDFIDLEDKVLITSSNGATQFWVADYQIMTSVETVTFVNSRITTKIIIERF